MASHNQMFFLDTRKGKITKRIHTNQAVCVDWLVSSVQAHVRLVGKDSLKIANPGRSIDPGRRHLCVCRCDGESVWITTANNNMLAMDPLTNTSLHKSMHLA